MKWSQRDEEDSPPRNEWPQPGARSAINTVADNDGEDGGMEGPAIVGGRQAGRRRENNCGRAESMAMREGLAQVSP